jgi:hypothetical protein
MVSWGLGKKGHFSTESLYRFITDGGVASWIAGHLWKYKIPLQVEIFLWQVLNNKLQYSQSLSSKKEKEKRRKGCEKCYLYGIIESVNHILFYCILARMIWGFLREIIKWRNCPTICEELV